MTHDFSTPPPPGGGRAKRSRKPFAIVGVIFGIVIGLLVLQPWKARTTGGGEAKTQAGAGDSGGLVVYCAHDSVYAEPILRAFEKKSGVKLQIRFDSEATKSLGLEEMLLREKGSPRCDVFWNNGPLGTMNLADQGVLRAYKGEGWKRIPEAFRDEEGRWAGFGARLRVYILNTANRPATEPKSPDPLHDPAYREVHERLNRPDLSKFVVAKPLYGTSLTHYAVIWHWGEQAGVPSGEGVKKHHSELRKRGVVEAMGNAQVAQLVANGVCDIGITDTDDYFVAKDEGKPVAMVPVMQGAAREEFTICIPNTAAIIQGSSRVEQAEKLVDYLLSEEVELALAASKARQIPLGAVDESKLPDDVKQLKAWAARGYPLKGLEKARAECLAWLKKGYLGE